jgi:hypothetical protein
MHLFVAALFALGLAAAQPSASPAPVRHLEYRFGWNANVADSGPYTGTLSVDLEPPNADGGVSATATELWWNAIRPTQSSTCDVGLDGSIACLQRPYLLSPMALALLPLLAGHYFDGLIPGGASNWKRNFTLTKGVGVWDCNFALNGQGAIAGSPQLDLVLGTGKISPQGDHYREETVDVTDRIAYDPVAKLPVLLNAEMMHNHARPRSLETVQLKLVKSSP